MFGKAKTFVRNLKGNMQKPEVYLKRVYRFSAAHRLWSPFLSEEENRKVYGKCSNPKGHGHNYILEITVKGVVDSKTGRVVSPEKLDQIVYEKILFPWDHKNLDEEVFDFQEKLSTGENMAQIVWEKLYGSLPNVALVSVKVSETSKAFFEYYGVQKSLLNLEENVQKVEALP